MINEYLCMLEKVLVEGFSKNEFHRSFFPEKESDFYIGKPIKSVEDQMRLDCKLSDNSNIYVGIMNFVSSDGYVMKISNSDSIDDLVKGIGEFLCGIEITKKTV